MKNRVDDCVNGQLRAIENLEQKNSELQRTANNLIHKANSAFVKIEENFQAKNDDEEQSIEILKAVS